MNFLFVALSMCQAWDLLSDVLYVNYSMIDRNVHSSAQKSFEYASQLS